MKLTKLLAVLSAMRLGSESNPRGAENAAQRLYLPWLAAKMNGLAQVRHGFVPQGTPERQHRNILIRKDENGEERNLTRGERKRAARALANARVTEDRPPQYLSAAARRRRVVVPLKPKRKASARRAG